MKIEGDVVLIESPLMCEVIWGSIPVYIRIVKMTGYAGAILIIKDRRFIAHSKRSYVVGKPIFN